MYFSLIIPVYNRPDEINELLESLAMTNYEHDFEVVIIEDGSYISSEAIANSYRDKLNITYYFKPNSGPGDSRNFGMQHAKGDYFIIFDSDCIIPPQYLTEVEAALNNKYTDCFGGPDQALDSFSDIQKAINFTMTSFLTTGGIRGSSEKIGKFQPRSFNMGLSKKAFEVSGGFGNIHPGEDPDLSIRLWNSGFNTQLFANAFVYHKRRIDWFKFYIQVNKFGKARPILNSWYPEHTKLTFFFPLLFVSGFFIALVLLVLGFSIFAILYGLYFLILFLVSVGKNRSLKIGLLSLVAFAIQFYGYGKGFGWSFFNIQLLKKDPKKVFPELFFK